MHKKFSVLLLVILVSFCGCSTKKDNISFLPEANIAVIPFSQPVDVSELLAGDIPTFQGLATDEEMANLDAYLEEKLSNSTHEYIFLTKESTAIPLVEDDSGRKSIFATYVAIARKAEVNYIIVPHIINWSENSGDVENSEILLVDYYVINAQSLPEFPDGFVLGRYRYDEKAIHMNTLLLRNDQSVDSSSVNRYRSMELAKESINFAIEYLSLT